MRVLVTGAAGFIGGHLLRALSGREHETFGRDKRWGGGSTARPDAVADMAGFRPQVIVHLGAQASTARSLADPAGDFVDNALGAVGVAEAARVAGGVPVIYVSTVKVGEGDDGQRAPLGLSKLVGEQYLELYRRLYGVPSVVLRPSTVYGPGQDGSAECGWVTWFIRAALTGQRIDVAGDGSQSRDVLFVDDFVALLVDIVEHFADYEGAACGVPYEVGGGPGNEVSLVGLLRELDYHDVRRTNRPPGDLGRVVSDNGRLSAVRGWAPTVGWREGVARTRAWLEEQEETHSG